MLLIVFENSKDLKEETKNAEPEKAEEEAEVKTEEEKPVEQPKE